MNRIVITLPEFVDNEASRIVGFLDSGALFVHLRKPDATEEEMRRLIEQIPECYRLRLSIHDHHDLAKEYNLGGVHLNSRSPEAPTGFSGRISRSCHSVEEVIEANDADYLFLSPIFESISKPGYIPEIPHEEIKSLLSESSLASRVYALGGIKPAHFNKLRRLGFRGCAMLGAAWTPIDRSKFKLQYITDDILGKGSVQQRYAAALQAIGGGCKWVQLRMKDAHSKDILDAAEIIRPACRKADAFFLLDDRIDLVKSAGADGVHLGKNDIPVSQARRILGPGYIIGATANTFDDIVRAYAEGADYIGLGPFRFTTTKKRLSPTLGIEGYRQIVKACRERGIDIPIVAIGGITGEDIPQLAATGINGIAVSGTITRAENPTLATHNLVKTLNTFI